MIARHQYFQQDERGRTAMTPREAANGSWREAVGRKGLGATSGRIGLGATSGRIGLGATWWRKARTRAQPRPLR
eukprot:1117036-Prymnesium_polylepis.2